MIKDFVALDLETTGFSPYFDYITEIGAAKYVDGIMVDRFETLVKPKVNIPPQITQITGITDDMVKDAPSIEEVISPLLDFIGDNILLGQNIVFDYSFIANICHGMGIKYQTKGIDTCRVSQRVLKDITSRSLESLCQYFSIETVHHRALADAVSAAMVYEKMCEIADGDDVFLMEFKPKKILPATDKQIKFLQMLIKRYKIAFDKKIEDLTKSQASREIDKILSEYGINR